MACAYRVAPRLKTLLSHDRRREAERERMTPAYSVIGSTDQGGGVLTGQSKAGMVQILALMAALVLVLIVLLFQIAQTLPWPAWMLPRMEMPEVNARVFSAAKAKGDPAGWILADDYPDDAIRSNMHGRVAIRFAIDEHGRVRRCDIVRSSGHAILDDAACSAIMRRGSFEPARDAAGNPVAVAMERNVVWRLPFQ